MYELILASASPRRSELLEKAGYKFTVHTVKVSENIEENLNSTAAVQDIARRKALAFVQQYKHLNLKGKVILTADTMVFAEGTLLGKPKDSSQAYDFLRSMSGKSHQVITALSLVVEGDLDQIFTRVESTDVEFRELDDKEIWDYIQSGEPMGKAGAYAIQGLGGQLVKEYRGSFSNVMGLPMDELEAWLKELRLDVSKKSIH